MTDTTKAWIHGLAAAFIGAAASSIGAILVAPDRFNLNSLSGLRNVVLASGLSGFTAAAAYLKSSPLPPLLTVKEEEHEAATDGKTAIVTDKTKTTTVSQ